MSRTRQEESKRLASKHSLVSLLTALGLIIELRIFSNALKKHVELRAPKLKLLPAPLRNFPLWQSDLSLVMQEMEGYSVGNLDGEAAEHDGEED
jgi:hypothetical protein